MFEVFEHLPVEKHKVAELSFSKTQFENRLFVSIFSLIIRINNKHRGGGGRRKREVSQLKNKNYIKSSFCINKLQIECNFIICVKVRTQKCIP